MNSMGNAKINHLEFKLIDPVLANERWVEGEKNLPDVVEIYIDGVEIAEIFRKIMSTEQMVLRNHSCEIYNFTPKNSTKCYF